MQKRSGKKKLPRNLNARAFAIGELTASLIKRAFGIAISGHLRFAAAALIWLAGQIARRPGT
jgi:hypothetical protein